MKSAFKKGGLIFAGLLLTIILVGQLTEAPQNDAASVDAVSYTHLSRDERSAICRGGIPIRGTD